MAENTKGTSIWATLETAQTLRLLSDRTGIPMTDLLDQIFKNVRKQLIQLNKDRRLLFLCDHDPANRMTHIRLSDGFLGLINPNDLPREIRDELNAQTEKENQELRGDNPFRKQVEKESVSQ